MQEGIKIDLGQDGIGTIEFYSENHNSLSSSVLRDISRAIQELSNDPNCRVVLLKGGGDRTFCAGANLDELLAITSLEQGGAFFGGFAEVINACRKSDKIIVGRVHGKAVGGGVGLIAACDYTFASKFASVRLSELNIGIGPFVVGPAIERKVGLNGLTELSLNPEKFFSAEWSKNHGLYHEVSEDTDHLDQRVAEFSRKLCSYSPDALSELKRSFWRNTENWDTLLAERAEISGRLVLGEQAQAAISSFKNKGGSK